MKTSENEEHNSRADIKEKEKSIRIEIDIYHIDEQEKEGAQAIQMTSKTCKKKTLQLPI